MAYDNDRKDGEGEGREKKGYQSRGPSWTRKPSGDRPYADRPQGDRPRTDRPYGDRPQGDRPRTARPYGDRPQGDRPRTDRPYGDRPQGDRPRTARPYGDRPQGDRPRTDRPYGDRPQGDRPRTARPYGDRPQGDRPRSDRPYGDRPQGDRPRSDRPFSDRPRSSRPFGDRPQGDRPRSDRPFGDRPQGDRPRSDRPFSDRPRSDRPFSDRPRSDRSFGDRPQSDRPRSDRPFSDRPRSDRSFGDRPQGDRPRSDRPFSDRPRFGGGEGGDRRNDGERKFERRDDRGERRSYPSSRPFDGGGERKFGEAKAFIPSDRRVALKDRDVHRVKDAAFEGTPYVEIYPDVELREDRLEGRNPIQEALKAGRTIDKLWVLRSSDGKIEPNLLKIVYAVRDAGGIVVEVEKPALDKMSQTHAHQGVIAQTAMHNYYEIEDLLNFAKEKGEKPFIILLDEIQDAYNLGSILRIADAVGVHGVVFPKRRAIGLDAVVAKASAGAIEHVKCCRVNNLVQTIESLKKEGVWIVGTSMDGEVFYENNRLSDSIALVIGSEGEGMRPLVEKHCDFKLAIPMMGQINSLNAAVAAGIIIFEAARQRQAAGGPKLKVQDRKTSAGSAVWNEAADGSDTADMDGDAETLEAFEAALHTTFETEVDAAEALNAVAEAMETAVQMSDAQGDAEV